MFDHEILRKCLDPSIKMNKLCLSYVARIFPEFKDTPCIILYKEKASESFDDHAKCFDDDQTSHFDITGSPLKYSFTGENDFEDTLIFIKQHYYKIEEIYLPLTRTEACNALNACIDFISDSCPPIFALCDAKDNKKSQLLGTIIEGDWFTTIEVCSDGIEALHSIKKSTTKIFEQHLELSNVCEQDINISACTIFDLFGTKEEMIQWDDKLKSNFEGSLSVEANSCSLSFYPPTRTSKNHLVAQIVTNSNNSPLKELWKQLLLLDRYLNILDLYTKNINTHYTPTPLEFPQDFTSPYKEEHDTILTNINLLLNGDYSFRSASDNETNRTNFLNEENIENDVKIEKYIQSLPFRYNLDFTDFLWELLIMNSNYFEITKCIHTVLEETIINGCLPQVNFTNTTRFAKVITNPQQQKIISHLLSGSLPLEYVIDMGLEKLYKDYIYILMNARFGDLHDFQEKLRNMSCNEFSIDTYRNKLLYLAQIHVCLEFMLLLQDNLECPNDDLRTLFCCAFSQFVGEKSSVKNCDLHQNKIYSLTAPLPFSAVNNLNKEIPSTRRISLTSQSKLSKLTTIRYYSQLSIFPKSIHALEDSNVMDAPYYVTSATCSSNKFKENSSSNKDT